VDTSRVAGVTLLDILACVRRQWLTALAVLLLVAAAAAALIALTPRSYVSTATIGIVPGSTAVSLDSFGQLSNVAPLYAELARSTAVRERTRDLVDGEVGATTVRTFRDTPLIIKLDATASTPEAAQTTATAFVEALQQEADTGAVAPRSQVAVQLFGAARLPDSPVSPRVNLIAYAAAIVGLVLAVVAAVFRDTPAPTRSRPTRSR
jgi:uncharacterized protein involved in exopolysaccharide biosynthesis